MLLSAILADHVAREEQRLFAWAAVLDLGALGRRLQQRREALWAAPAAPGSAR